MAWRMIGFDLDNLCTDSVNRAGECTPMMGAPAAIDGVDGIDNQFGSELFPLVNVAVPGLEATARGYQMAGQGLPLLRMRGWNGTMNDSVVDIVITSAVFSTAGTGTTAPPAVTVTSPTHQTLADGSPLPAPAWDGQDWAWVRADSFAAGDLEMPLVEDDQAYVANGLVVAHLPQRIDIIFPTNTVGVLVRLTGAVAVGTLSPDGMTLNNVVVAGRWAVNDLLATAENIGLCRGMGEYTILQSQLARDADLRSIPPQPGDPILSCDAISLGVGFTGYRMRIATATPGLAIIDLCTTDAGFPSDTGVTTDAGSDAGNDAGNDAGSDAGHDAGSDAGVDGG